MPEFFAPEEIARRDTLIARLVEEAPRVVLSSESAAADFRAFYPGHATKAHVLTFSTPPIRYPREDPPADAPPRFFLVCNQFWQHKNHLVIFDALQILRSRGIRPIVLCTGQLDDYRDPAYASRIRALLSRENLGEQVTLLGLLPRGRQIALMRQALAVIQPSLFEGWSTVVEDARALGRPTLLSDIPVHREQDPFFAHYFPPQSAEALADLISEAWQHWPAGPNLEEEPFAHARSMVRSAQVGARFLEIAE
jgi:glycosyltransferase involved in cell wall biosynthesis